jgi:hypothetical protein
MQRELRKRERFQSRSSPFPRLREVHHRLNGVSSVACKAQKLGALEQEVGQLKEIGDLGGVAEVWAKIIVLRHHLAAQGVLR